MKTNNVNFIENNGDIIYNMVNNRKKGINDIDNIISNRQNIVDSAKNIVDNG
jgi:hypothetical protein